MHKLMAKGCAAGQLSPAQPIEQNSYDKSIGCVQATQSRSVAATSSGCAIGWPNLQEAAKLIGVERSVLQRRVQRGEFRAELVHGNGGQQYRIDPLSLPEAARNAWLAKFISTVGASAASNATEIVPAKSPKSTVLANVGDCSHEQRLVCDARLFVLRIVEQLQQRLGTRSKAVKTLLAQRDRALLPADLMLAMAIGNDRNGFRFDVRLENAAPTAVPWPSQNIVAFADKLSDRAIHRWCQAYAEGGDAALIPLRREADMSIPAWAPYFLDRKNRYQGPEVVGAYREMLSLLPGDIQKPSYTQVYRWFTEKYSNIDKKRGTTQGSSLNEHKFAHKRTSKGMLPMQENHSDGWGTHFTAPHPVSGKFVKLEVWHTHDVATRYVFEPSIGLSESMMVILGSLFNVIKTAGVPAVWQTDNTGSVKNDRVEFDPSASLKARLGCEIVHNLPGNSQANGICENFNKYLDRCARELATYTGKTMDSLAAKRVHKITQKMVNAADSEERRRLKREAERVGSGIVFDGHEQAVEWIRTKVREYNDRPHRALPKITGEDGRRRHMTPKEAWQRHIDQGWMPVALDADELRDAFRPHETVKVVRGCVRVFSQRYHDPMLEQFNGEPVQVAYDMDDGERVFVKDMTGRLICEAKFYSDRAYRPLSFYEYAMGKRADAAQKRLQVKMAEIERQRPVEAIEMQTAHTLSDVVDVPRVAQAMRVPAKQADAVIDVESNVVTLPETPRQRFGRWLELERTAVEGGALAGRDLIFYTNYPQGSEWKAMRSLHEEEAGELQLANARQK
ncbi:Mu transposase C-terminal domain-containing protein [Burkholderia sp. RS02]|uniref:Mu transposase C-terminal domain-containing protein n=1 Tax=unclassified Burkholderia TaxID=2613784 RepID=UPI0032189186